ncbi:MAG: glycosyltransferase, partial [Phenylobacterium sp.]|nr:glycosyltransferase [Phenylobacterium sp.]
GPLQGPQGAPVALRHAQALGRLAPKAIAAWLARAPIYASAALYEPFGLGVLEAAQAGCALVLSDIPTFRELWDGAAVFAEPDEPRAFAGVCRELLADTLRRESLSREARARAARYSADAMTAGMLAIYRLRRPERFRAARVEAAE